MGIDSPLATVVRESYGSRSGKYKPRDSCVAIVVHTTGSGPVRRHKSNPRKFKSPFEAALHIYANMSAGPHYVVGQEGEVAQTCPEYLAAWHVGSSGAHHYRKNTWHWRRQRFAWWRDYWEMLGMRSPLELAGGKLWEGGSCNQNTIGIEVVPNALSLTGRWSETTYRTLAALVRDIADRQAIALARDTILTHSEAHPVSRTTRTGIPWDTRVSQWDWESFRPYLTPSSPPTRCPSQSR